MNKDEREAINIMAHTFNEIAQNAVQNANFDQTIIGLITKISGATYTVLIDNKEYQMKSCLSGLSVGQQVRVCIPNGDFNSKYISGTLREYTVGMTEITGVSEISNTDIDSLF